MNSRPAALAISAALAIFAIFGPAAAQDSRGPITIDPEALAKAPAIGKVVAYNGDWGFAVINAGTKKGVKEGTRLAIRRRGKVVIIGIVEDVSANQSSIGFVDLRPYGRDANRPHLGDEAFIYPPRG